MQSEQSKPQVSMVTRSRAKAEKSTEPPVHAKRSRKDIGLLKRATLPNEIYDDIAKFLKISSYKDIVFTSRRMRWIMDPFMRRQKIQSKVFCRNQLEDYYNNICDYIAYDERRILAETTNLGSRQIKVWFQNRRARIKAQKKKSASA